MMVRPINQLPDFVKEKLTKYGVNMSMIGLVVVTELAYEGLRGDCNVRRIYGREGDFRIHEIKHTKNQTALKFIMLADVAVRTDGTIVKNRYGRTDV